MCLQPDQMVMSRSVRPLEGQIVVVCSVCQEPVHCVYDLVREVCPEPEQMVVSQPVSTARRVSSGRPDDPVGVTTGHWARQGW